MPYREIYARSGEITCMPLSINVRGIKMEKDINVHPIIGVHTQIRSYRTRYTVHRPMCMGWRVREVRAHPSKLGK